MTAVVKQGIPAAIGDPQDVGATFRAIGRTERGPVREYRRGEDERALHIGQIGCVAVPGRDQRGRYCRRHGVRCHRTASQGDEPTDDGDHIDGIQAEAAREHMERQKALTVHAEWRMVTQGTPPWSCSQRATALFHGQRMHPGLPLPGRQRCSASARCCRLVDLDPYKYLVEIFAQLHTGRADYGNLRP